ncbi:integrase core domain-containing protein [Streptomyces sp. NPDC007856]|uniref:integrase core domain-containing protein n=1 Tax=Streptomyces sp. NPDC007856 TaxID=3364781 RepID=UPI0036A40A22
MGGGIAFEDGGDDHWHFRGRLRLQEQYRPDQGHAHRHTFATRTEARLKTATWIADFYNTKRRHSAAGGKPPVEFERDHPGGTSPDRSGRPGRITNISTKPGD